MPAYLGLGRRPDDGQDVCTCVGKQRVRRCVRERNFKKERESEGEKEGERERVREKERRREREGERERER